MPTQTTVNMIFLGTFADVDTDESNSSAENEGNLLGQYDNLVLTSIVENDQNDDGAISDNETQAAAPPENGVDFLSYDVGFGDESYQIDSTMAYNAVVTLGDGSTQEVLVAVLQTTIGDVFIRDVGNGLDNLNIQSIQLVSVVNDTFSGSVTGNSIENSQVVCFLCGSLIKTTTGYKKVEALRVGDMIETRDDGPQPIKWISSQPVGDDPLSRPIEVAAGALGPGQPMHKLQLSPDHRVLVRSKIARRMFGEDEVLVPIKRFLGAKGFRRAQRPSPNSAYVHILLPNHAVIDAQGAWVESLFPGTQTLTRLPVEPRKALRAALAALGHPAALGYLPARPFPQGRMQRRLIWRHRRNDQPFVDDNMPSVSDDGVRPLAGQNALEPTGLV